MTGVSLTIHITIKDLPGGSSNLTSIASGIGARTVSHLAEEQREANRYHQWSYFSHIDDMRFDVTEHYVR